MTPAAEKLRSHLAAIYAPIDRSAPEPSTPMDPPPDVIAAAIAISKWADDKPPREVLVLLCACGVFD
jgi:hypothetical protein